MIGTALGTVGRLGVWSGSLTGYKLFHLPGDVYFIDTLPVALEAADLTLIIAGQSADRFYRHHLPRAARRRGSFRSRRSGMSEVPASSLPGPEDETPRAEPQPAAPARLLGRALRKVYTQEDGSELPILEGVEIAIARGEAVAIVGASGTGKSTLLHLLGGLDRPTSGEVLLDGVDLSGLNDRELAGVRNQRIGFVFQFHHLLREFTALENVMMPMLIGGRDRRDGARPSPSSCLARWVWPQRVSHKPWQLSGGEQQRVAVARAWPMQPPCCSRTSRAATWTRTQRNSCTTCFSSCARSTAWRWCSRPTTESWPTEPTGSCIERRTAAQLLPGLTECFATNCGENEAILHLTADREQPDDELSSV